MIPIANIYYLLCYAWGHTHSGEQIPIGTDDVADVANLVARVLLNGTNRLRRRGLQRSYRNHREQVQRIRGRIDFSASISSLAFEACKAVCEFDELTADNPQNQILKATLQRLSNTTQVDRLARVELAHLARAFHEVSDIKLSITCFTRLQIYSQSTVYRFLIQLCRLAYDSMLPLEDGNGWKFSDFSRDEARMAKLFEDFVFSFYSVEQSEYRVKRDSLKWDVGSASGSSLQYLPEMKTDVTLRSSERTIVLDAKYYQQTLGTFYGKESIHSGNLYQMFSYLKNMEQFAGEDARATGILLYPTVQKDIDLAYDIQGHELRICTVNLAVSRIEIHDRLLCIIGAMPMNESLAA